MLKGLITSLAALSIALSSITAFAEATVYGKVNVSAVNEDDGTDKVWKLTSNASRVGFKGSADLDNDIEAIFKLEYEVAVDDGDAECSTVVTGITDTDNDGNLDTTTTGTTCDSFKQRNIYGGFKGTFGQIIAGKHDTPLKKAQGKLDLFNDLPLGDIKNLIKSENREDNMIMYTSPKLLGGLTTNIAVMQGEDAGGENDGLTDFVSASVKYKMDKIWAAAAMDDQVDGWDVVRLATGLDFVENLTLGLIVESAEESEGANPKEETFNMLSAKYKMGKLTYKAQYSMAEKEDNTGILEDETLASLGLDYKLGGKSKLYTYLSSYEDEIGASEEDVFAIGYEIKF